MSIIIQLAFIYIVIGLPVWVIRKIKEYFVNEVVKAMIHEE